MLLFTIYSAEQIFGVEETPKTEMRKIKGGLVEVRGYNGRYEIQRLISTDPHMFLDGGLAPGSVFPDD